MNKTYSITPGHELEGSGSQESIVEATHNDYSFGFESDLNEFGSNFLDENAEFSPGDFTESSADYEAMAPTYDDGFESTPDPASTQLLEAILGSFPESEQELNYLRSQREVVIGRDDRKRVTDTRPFPWRAICHLDIRARNGKRYLGTGWFVGPRTIITAGHCVFLHAAGGWASSITVTPGRNGRQAPFGSIKAKSFRSVRGWVRSKNRSFDYGAIILPKNCNGKNKFPGKFNFAVMGNTQIKSRIANLSGYPGDKPRGTQWRHSRRIKNALGHRLIYDIDTAGGQSGSPVWIVQNKRPVAVGIHTNGSLSGNSATRITKSVAKNIVRWRSEGNR